MFSGLCALSDLRLLLLYCVDGCVEDGMLKPAVSASVVNPRPNATLLCCV